MKHFLLSCVNYNSYNELVNYLKSIDEAAEQAKELVHVDVVISDNSINKKIIDTSGFTSINCQTFLNENVGYLGAALSLINQADISQYDFVIISNVDLKLSTAFFNNIISIDLTDKGINISNIGWISPRIFTEKYQKDESPLMIKRPTKFKLILLEWLYRIDFLEGLYIYFHQFRHRERKYLSSQSSCEIYAGHGSLMIFTQMFFLQNQKLVFPSFMYAEEIYFAELVRLTNLKTVYIPGVYVENIGNVSTTFLGYKKRCSMNLKSLSTVRKMFFTI